MLLIYDTLDTLLYTLRRPYFRKMENQDALVCISESIPEPTVEWVFCNAQSERYDIYRGNCYFCFIFWSFSNIADITLCVPIGLSEEWGWDSTCLTLQ